MPVFGGLFGVAGIGAELGTARGAIVIDTSQAQSAAQTMRRVGQDIEQSFTGIGGTIQGIGKQIKSFQRELTVLGAAAGAITGFGLGSARDLRNYRVQFGALLGDYGKAERVMTRLTEQANRFGMEVTEVWQLGRSLIPVLEDGADTLDVWVKRAALLASTNPLKGTTDAVRAIQEYLAGQPRSLQFLFNVDPNLIQEAQRASQDYGEQLDYILTRMGATEEGALAMADAWVAVRNELKLLVGTAFTPFLQELQPILRGVSDFISRLRESDPELLTFGAGLVGAAAAAAPLLIVLGQVIGALGKIKGLVAAVPLLGKLGVTGAALAVGAGAGVGIARGIGTATGDERMAGINLSDIGETIKQAAFVAVDTLNKVFMISLVKAVEWVASIDETIANFEETLGRFIKWIGSIIPDRLGGSKLDEAGQRLIDAAGTMREGTQEELRSFTEALVAKYEEGMREIGQRWFPDLFPQTGQGGGGFVGTDTGADGAGGGFNEEAVEIFREHLQAVRDIEDETGRERARIIEQYDQDIVKTEEQYGQRRTALIESFAQQQAEAAEDFAHNWQRAMRDFIQSERQIEEDYYRQRAERAAAAGTEQAQAEEDHQREMRRLREDSEARQYDLIAKRDALGLIRERRNYEVQRQRAEEDYRVQAARRSADTARQLAEMDADFARARERRLAAFEQRRADEEQDFQRRQARELAHHQQQLAELDASLQEQTALLVQRKAEELAALDETTKSALDALERQTAQRINAIDSTLLGSYWAVQYAGQSTINVTQRLIQWIDQLNKRALGVPSSGYGLWPTRASGGYATSGIYQLGELGREFVLSADTTRAAEMMARGNLDQRTVLGMMAGERGGKQIVYQDQREIRFYGSLSAEERQRIRSELRADMVRTVNAVLGAN